MSKNTLREYKRRAEANPSGLATLLALTDEELRPFICPEEAGAQADRRLVFQGKVDHYIKELQRPHVTRMLLYEEYKKDFPEGYSQSRFYHHLGQAIERHDLSLPLTHPPGKTLQLDYAGKKMRWVDARSGEVHEVQVLLAVLPHSAHTFAIALPSQSTADFVHGHTLTITMFIQC